MKMFGQTIKTDKMKIEKGNMIWDIDLIEKTGSQYKGLELPPEVAAAMGTAIGGAMMEGMEIYTAITELSENAPPKSKFEVPEGIEITKEEY
jgi:hypothetical protein